MPICLECGEAKKILVYSHLKKCCGLTPKEYRQKHGNVKLIDDNIRLKIARHGKNNSNYKHGYGKRKPVQCPSCGEHMSGNGEVCHNCAVKQGKNDAYA
jgi:hypothetical protein